MHVSWTAPRVPALLVAVRLITIIDLSFATSRASDHGRLTRRWPGTTSGRLIGARTLQGV
jgi:hypothetical protein